MGHCGQWVPDWQLDPIKRRLVQSILKQLLRGIDTWDIYHALLRSYEALGIRPTIEADNPTNPRRAARLVRESIATDATGATPED